MIIEPKVEMDLGLLNSRFNAHLTFNVLNALQYLVLEEEKEDAYKLIGSYSRILRSMLINGSIQTNLGAELDIITDYMELERIRMDEKFSYYISVSKSIRSLFIPRSLIISIIENAIKHGMRPLGSKGFIRIDCPDPTYNIIRIRNNAPSKQFIRKGDGMDLTIGLIRRFNRLNGSNISIRTNSQPKTTDPSVTVFESLILL